MTTIYKNKHIYYEVHGNQEPLILLNGIMMSTKSWQPLLKAFKNYQVILIDLFDQGQTDDHASYTINDQSDLVIHIMDVLALKRVHLVGISYGGEVALHIATKAQSRIQTLHIFHSACYTDKDLYNLGETWLELTKNLKGDAFYEATIPYIYGKTFKNEHASWMRARETMLRTVFKQENFLNRMHRLTQSSQHFDCRNELHQASIPTIIVSGSEDVLIPIKYQQEIKKYMKHASHIIVENVGHAMMYEKPEMFVSLINGFISTSQLKITI